MINFIKWIETELCLIKLRKYKFSKKEYRLISNSKFFNRKWYNKTYKDVKNNKIDPAYHYLVNGWREHRNPSKIFNSDIYLSDNKDVAASGINPLVHYEKIGKKMGINISHHLIEQFPIEMTLAYNPCRPKFSETRQQCVNIFIPVINSANLTGGLIGILQLGNLFLKKGMNVRFLVFFDKKIELDALKKCPGLSELADKAEFELIASGQDVEINKNDICVATFWISAYWAAALQKECHNKKFIYLIQDYEPIFYAHSSVYALCDETYRLNYNALFSTDLLKEYFINNDIQGIKSRGLNCMSFDAATSGYLPSLDIFKKNRKKKKQLVFYGRPYNPRNMYELGIYLINEAIKEGVLNPNEWEFWSIGFRDDIIHLDGDCIMKALPYMPLKKYTEMLYTFDLGISFILSPHPSMIPLDLAVSGTVCLTNTYKNKTPEKLYKLSKNIFAAEPNINDLLETLKKAVASIGKYDQRYQNAVDMSYSRDWADTFSDQQFQWLKSCIKGINS